MEIGVLAIALLVYLGMFLGGIPGLALDRTGVAFLGSVLLLTLGAVKTDSLPQAVDLPTIALLFGLMIVSAQFRLAGFYTWLVRKIGRADVGPAALLGLSILTTGFLSELLANDIVCLAVAPVLIEICSQHGLNPKPFLLSLACSANVGSAATLIGNPQNMLIGQVLRLSFSGYLWDALPPALLGLGLTWLIILLLYRGRWEGPVREYRAQRPELNRWQTYKGITVLAVLVVYFLVAPWPREVAALAAAGLLLCSRKMRSREILGLVDWQLLVLILSLFIVNFALRNYGHMALLLQKASVLGIDLNSMSWLFGLSVVLSNLVSNVPAVMLLLPSASHPLAGPVLALSSTLAGNLLVIGSIANIIVLDQAERHGVKISWKEHARVGVPVTLLTLTLAALWLWVRSI